MTIRYALRRADIWNVYWFIWRTGWRLKLSQVFIAGCTIFVALSVLARNRPISGHDVVIALLWAGVVLLFLPVYPLLMFKPQTRTLTITPQGIDTQIANMSRELPWRKISRIQRDGDRLYIIGRTGNSFVVPDHAFSSPEDRETFEMRIRQWWNDAAA